MGLLSISHVAFAQEVVDSCYFLTVWFTNGDDNMDVYISNKPLIMIEGEEIIFQFLSKDGNPEKYEKYFFTHDIVRKFTLDKKKNEQPTDIHNVDEQPIDKIHLQNGEILICWTPNSSVNIFTTSGMLVRNCQTDVNGYLRYSLNNLPKGTYIVRLSNNTSYKIQSH